MRGHTNSGRGFNLFNRLRRHFQSPPGPHCRTATSADPLCARMQKMGRGRDGDYSPPPAQIPACGFPAPGSCRRSNVTGVRGLAAHAVPVRRQATLVTCLIRHGVRGMPCHLPSLQPGPFPPPPPPPFITGLFGRFIGTTSPSDSSPVPRQLRLLDFLSRPGIAAATAGQTRSPRFRRDPFVRDVASDPGRATAPRMTTPHMLPSTPLTVSAPAK